jgi:hypothetical protein
MHEGPLGAMTLASPNPSCARRNQQSRVRLQMGGSAAPVRTNVVCIGRGWCVARCGTMGYDFCWNRGEGVCGVPFLCARGEVVVGEEKRRGSGLSRRPGLKATGRRSWCFAGMDRKTTPARRLRYGLPAARKRLRRDLTGGVARFGETPPLHLLHAPDTGLHTFGVQEGSAAARRLRFGPRQQGGGFAALLSRGAPLRGDPWQQPRTPLACSRQSRQRR